MEHRRSSSKPSIRVRAASPRRERTRLQRQLRRHARSRRASPGVSRMTADVRRAQRGVRPQHLAGGEDGKVSRPAFFRVRQCVSYSRGLHGRSRADNQRQPLQQHLGRIGTHLNFECNTCPAFRFRCLFFSLSLFSSLQVLSLFHTVVPSPLASTSLFPSIDSSLYFLCSLSYFDNTKIIWCSRF